MPEFRPEIRDEEHPNDEASSSLPKAGVFDHHPGRQFLPFPIGQAAHFALNPGYDKLIAITAGRAQPLVPHPPPGAG